MRGGACAVQAREWSICRASHTPTQIRSSPAILLQTASAQCFWRQANDARGCLTHAWGVVVSTAVFWRSLAEEEQRENNATKGDAAQNSTNRATP